MTKFWCFLGVHELGDDYDKIEADVYENPSSFPVARKSSWKQKCKVCGRVKLINRSRH